MPRAKTRKKSSPNSTQLLLRRKFIAGATKGTKVSPNNREYFIPGADRRLAVALLGHFCIKRFCRGERPRSRFVELLYIFRNVA